MTSPNQSETSRVNGSQSHGPVTAEGKARSSRNSLKSGLYAKSLIIAGEDPAAFEALTAEYYAEYQPAAPAERHQLDIMIRSEWQLRRLAVTETKLWNARIDNVYRPTPAVTQGVAFSDGSLAFIRLRRLFDATERSYQTALRELERLQSARHKAEPTTDAESPTQLGFVPSTTGQPDPQTKEKPPIHPPAPDSRPQAPAEAPGFVPFTTAPPDPPTKEKPNFLPPAPDPRPQAPENAPTPASR